VVTKTKSAFTNCYKIIFTNYYFNKILFFLKSTHMKNTQKTLITILLLSVSIVSCHDKTLEETASKSSDANARRGLSGFSIKVTALPPTILMYIIANYPNKTITKAEVYPTLYEITLSDLAKLKFDLKGQIITDKGSSTTSTEIPVASLPDNIANYMNANYPNNQVVKAEKDAAGFEVTIDTGLKLEFNLDGTFREISGSNNNNEGNAENGEHITTQALPAATLTYLATNYPNNPVVKAEKYASGYEVTLNTGLKLEFNVDGTFREISGSNNNTNNGVGNNDHITTQTLPTATLAYLLANYPNNSVVKAEKDGSGYEVTLNTGLKLEFNADGTFKEISGSGGSPNSGSSNSGNGNSGSSNSGSSNSGSSNSGSSNSGSGNSGSSNSGSSKSGSDKDGGKDSGKSEKEKKGKG
jgi:Putative beta-lactamase-inhibitor-like, PepSY-like